MLADPDSDSNDSSLTTLTIQQTLFISRTKRFYFVLQ